MSLTATADKKPPRLPYDVLALTGEFLCFPEQAKARRVSRRWRTEIGHCCQILWTRMVKDVFTSRNPNADIRWAFELILRNLDNDTPGLCEQGRRMPILWKQGLPIPLPSSCISSCLLMSEKLFTLTLHSPLLPVFSLNGANLLQTTEKWLQQAYQDHALVQFWKEIRSALNSSVPPFTKAEEIRTWMNDPANTDPLNQVTGISLRKRELKVIPKEIGKLSNLQRLVLDHNKIEKIPPEIGQLSKLLFLILSRNKIEKIPPEIGQLTQLRHLALDDNEIEELPSEIKTLVLLQELFLGGNRIKKIPPEIQWLAQLQQLELDNNCIAEIPHEIRNLGALKVFSLSCNRIETVPPVIGYLFHLKELYLTHNLIAAISPALVALLRRESVRLDFFGNPLLVVPKELLANPAFKNRHAIATHAQASKCTGVFPMAQLCLAIMHENLEEIARLFQQLTPEEKRPIVRRIWELAGYPEDGGERHALEDLSRLARVVACSIIERVEALPEEQEDAVYERVCAQTHELEDGIAQGAQILAKTYLPLMADVLGKITEESDPESE